MAACPAGPHGGLGARELLGAQSSSSRGGASAEAATNPVSAWTPHQPPITARPTSCPPCPLFPLARWPPRVSGLLTSARGDQAVCRVAGPARGPPGLAVVPLHAVSSAPSGSGGSGQSVLGGGF